MIWVKLAHQSLTISGDSGYGGESIGIFSAVDTSENVIFSGAGKTHNHDSVWVYGTNAVGSTDSGLTITSTGAANFADYGNGGLHNPLSSITFAHSASGDTAFPGINWGSGGTVETTDASAFTGALTLGSVAALLLLLLLVLSLRQLSSVIQVQARLPATLSSLVPARPIFLRTLSLMVPVVITSHCWLVIRPLTRWTVPRLLVGVEQCRDLHFRS